MVWAIDIHGPAGTRPTPENLGLLGVRKGDWKLVCDQKRQVNALYNLKNDLAENQDLSAENPEMKKELLAYGARELQSCPPSYGQLAKVDTRKTGDQEAADEMKARCGQLYPPCLLAPAKK